MISNNEAKDKIQVIVLDDYQDQVRELECFDILGDEYHVTIYNYQIKSQKDLLSSLEHADVIIPIRERTKFDSKLIKKLPNLKMISQTGTGTSHIDLDACEQAGIKVSVSNGYSYSTAELTWALILASVRHIPQEVKNTKEGLWQGFSIGTCLRGKTLGIFGYGNIGKIVASYGRAFGMNVLIYGRESSLEKARKDGFTTTGSKEQFFMQSDIVSLHLKLNSGTKNIISLSDLMLMKSTSHLINTSRAEIIENGALLEGLKKGKPGFAAVDVYEKEPEVFNPLFNMSNVICTPHLGYYEKETYEVFFKESFENIINYYNK